MASKRLTYNKALAESQYERTQDRFVLKCKYSGGKEYIFKGLIGHSDQQISDFYKEINVIKELSLESLPYKVDQIIDEGETPSPWFIVNFFNGEVSGNIFEYKKEFANDDFAKFIILSLKQLKKKSITVREKKDQLFDRWLDKTQAKISKSQKPETLLKINKVVYFLKEYASKNDNLVFSHNDLSPLNILSKNQEYLIVDWEACGYNIAPFDLGYCYQRAWRYPKFQAILSDHVKEKDHAFHKAFNYLLVILICLDLATFEKALNGFVFKHSQTFSPAYLNELKAMYKLKLETLMKEIN